ncbi:MAG: hypothetical protein ACREEW_03480, partial [Caulobacteraceae bacterium]
MVDIASADADPAAPRLSDRWRSALVSPALPPWPRGRLGGRAPFALRVPWLSPAQSEAARPFPAVASVPPAARLAMPRQNLSRAPAARRLPVIPATAIRRLILMLGAGAVAAASAEALWDVLGADGLSAIEWLVLALTAILGAWVGFGFMSAGAGFIGALRGGLAQAAAPRPGAIASRTAILLP